MKFLARFFRRFRRLSVLEASILEFVAGELPENDRPAFRAQMAVAYFRRDWRIVTFDYERPPAAIARFADSPSTRLAVVTAKGQSSKFTVVATVSLVHGMLRTIEFNMIPWSHSEALEIQGQIVAPSDPLSNSSA